MMPWLIFVLIIVAIFSDEIIALFWFIMIVILFFLHMLVQGDKK